MNRTGDRASSTRSFRHNAPSHPSYLIVMLYQPGAKIADRYEIVRPLGKGAFGSTFLARDERGRHVAVKVLDPARAADWKAFELFARETEVLLSLRHRGVPEVYESFRTESSGTALQCLVMEYVEGESLAATIEAGRRLDPPGVMHLFTELVGVLDYLHSRVPPILHRDIKPANIIIRPDGTPTLVDFGSVRSVHRPDAGSTVAGTYGYIPYEQYMGHASPASDLYGLGATFLHLVTGLAPPQFMTDEGRSRYLRRCRAGSPSRASWSGSSSRRLTSGSSPPERSARRSSARSRRRRAGRWLPPRRPRWQLRPESRSTCPTNRGP